MEACFWNFKIPKYLKFHIEFSAKFYVKFYKDGFLVKYLLFKYLRFDRSQPFITLSALLAFLGVGVGLTVLIVAMAIMNGFDKEFERKLFTMNYPAFRKTTWRGCGRTFPI